MPFPEYKKYLFNYYYSLIIIIILYVIVQILITEFFGNNALNILIIAIIIIFISYGVWFYYIFSIINKPSDSINNLIDQNDKIISEKKISCKTYKNEIGTGNIHFTNKKIIYIPIISAILRSKNSIIIWDVKEIKRIDFTSYLNQLVSMKIITKEKGVEFIINQFTEDIDDYIRIIEKLGIEYNNEL